VTSRSVADIDALILAELERCDRLGVEPGADHMRLVTERRKAKEELAEEAEKGRAA
jgi:hypothetical protein